MIKIEQDKKYLVTGGAGFLGGDLIERIINQGGYVVTVSRNEGKLITLKQKYPNNLEIHTGDICDDFTLPRLMRGITGVFHLAAFKHVGLAETQSRECVKSNVVGSINVLEQSVKNNVEFVIGISTDKAAQIGGVYGATKYLMERLFNQFEHSKKPKEPLRTDGENPDSQGEITITEYDIESGEEQSHAKTRSYKHKFTTGDYERFDSLLKRYTEYKKAVKELHLLKLITPIINYGLTVVIMKQQVLDLEKA